MNLQAPCMNSYNDILGHIAYRSSFHENVITARQPLYITFREHYCFSPSVAVPLYDDEDSFKNSFLPPGCQLTEVEVIRLFNRILPY